MNKRISFPLNLFIVRSKHMRALLCVASLILLLGYGPAAHAAHENILDQFNVEQILLFLVPHLRNSLNEPGILYYRFQRYQVSKTGSKRYERLGLVTLRVPRPQQNGQVHSVINFLKGETDGLFKDVHNNGANPVVTTFLQWDVNYMATLMGAHPDYFRHLIRHALASRSINHEKVEVAYKQRSLEAVRVLFKPFPPEIIKSKVMQQLAQKQYEFIIGSEFPGGIYQVTTTLPDSSNGTIEYTVVSLDAFVPAFSLQQ